GIRFAALRAASPDPLADERHDVARYLEEEVLGRLPARVRDLLMRTSVLDRMCGELADALSITDGPDLNNELPPAEDLTHAASHAATHTERTHSDEPTSTAPGGLDSDRPERTCAERDLEELSASGGFVLALGGTPAWYRYHRQFRETLRAELGRTRTQQVGRLHARAASWLSRHGMPVDAMRHAWASGDRARVTSLGQAEWADLALSGCHATVADRESTTYQESTSDRASGESTAAGPATCTDPELAVAYVVERLGRGDSRAVDVGLHLMAQCGQSTMAIRALRLARDRLNGDLVGIDASATALLELTEADPDPHHLRVRAVALAAQAAVLLGAGDLGGAADALAETELVLDGPPGPVLADPVLDGPVCVRRAAAGTRSLLLAVSGELRAAEQAARAALAVPACQGHPRDVHCGPAYLALAVASHEWNRPAEAARFFDLAERAHRLTVEPELTAWITLIGTWLRGAQGDLTGAFDTLSAGRLAAGGAGVPVRMEPWFDAAEAELRIAHGDTRTARTTLTQLLAEADAGEGSGEGTAALAVLLARALLRDGDPHAAARTLPPWSDDEKADTVLSVRLDAGLIEAQVARALGDRRRAAQTLERVLDLAEPHGFRRPFTKDADALRDLLADHMECGTAHWSTVSALVEQPRQRAPRQAPAAGCEPMTERETTVLRYLQSMLSNEEIAAKLFVSVNTVKTHVRHIYRKLDVSHRRDAVRRARELRLL
ncbi:MAG: LuxR family transcriptional regulator, maltose regulon positive regulatory protein, partial [Micromonosporaceae bacterium]|nr:LuxR family transcriptional regulator, maltose regulon positive regulatory protein [Micromonosporaceae bacterium]